MVYQWFTDIKYSTLYYIEDDKIKLNSSFKGLKTIIHLSKNSNILFKPSVITDEDDNTFEAVDMMINSDKSITSIKADTIIALIHILETTNLYTLGLMAMCYLQRPEFGMYEFNFNNVETNKQTNYTTSKINRLPEEEDEVIKRFFK